MLPAGDPLAGSPKRPGPWWATRRDARSAGVVLAAMAVAGLLLGVVWYLISPRLGFRIDSSGNILPLGAVESEALIGADGRFVGLTALAGLVAGLLCWWRLRAVRGPAVAVGLAAGGVVGALITSVIGHLLGHGPSAAALHQVGNVVHAPLELRSKVGLIAEPFVALAAYVIGAGFAGDDDLGRSPGQPANLPAPSPDFLTPDTPPG
ncbi:MAG TPA: hypothetical protein VFX70_01065 [Mycobacteriales bacterium]|nr:hypothetical protein [Mycobacteriales bacterium]